MSAHQRAVAEFIRRRDQAMTGNRAPLYEEQKSAFHTHSSIKDTPHRAPPVPPKPTSYRTDLTATRDLSTDLPSLAPRVSFPLSIYAY